MEYIRKTVDSASLRGIFDLPATLQKVEVIVLLPAENVSEKATKPKIQLGFVKGPPLPDSFFDPLPEEELQAWELAGSG